MSIATGNCGRLGRQALPWFGLFCVLLALTRLVQVPAVSLPAAVTAPPVVTTNAGMPAVDAPSSAGSGSVLVTITIRDVTTGSQAQLLCRTTGDRSSSDALVMDAETARDILPALCGSTSVSAPVSYNR
jgi:hypothetical protein